MLNYKFSFFPRFSELKFGFELGFYTHLKEFSFLHAWKGTTLAGCQNGVHFCTSPKEFRSPQQVVLSASPKIRGSCFGRQ